MRRLVDAVIDAHPQLSSHRRRLIADSRRSTVEQFGRPVAESLAPVTSWSQRFRAQAHQDAVVHQIVARFLGRLVAGG